MRRVVVTGLGPVTPIGVGASAYHRSQLEGHSGARAITLFDAADLPVRIAAEVDVGVDAFIEPREQKRLDRFAQLAIIAAQLALEDAGLDLGTLDRSRVGAVIGSGVGGIATWEAQARIGFERGMNRMSPFTVPMLMANAASIQLSIRYGLRGPVSTTVSACASGTEAIGIALRAIQHGEADAMLAGGAESMITGLAMGAFAAMRALSPRNEDPATASRPFSRDRDGFLMGEGAGVLLLEELEHARKRGARIYAELAGFGRAADAHHITEPHPEGAGLALAMNVALEDAGLNTDEVAYVNAHATSTPLGDRAEVIAIERTFRDHARKLAVSSTKSMIGHGLGAAGGMEAIAAVQALFHRVIPPTINLSDPDPELRLDFVPNEAREARPEVVISNSSGFGGLNAVVAFRRFA